MPDDQTPPRRPRAAVTSRAAEGDLPGMEEVGRSCYALAARMTARALTRVYDAAVRPHGLRFPQFGILGAVALDLDLSETALAGRLGLERTTLVRNIRLLERKGWVEKASGSAGVRHRLTPRGLATLQAALPSWRAAQAEIEGRLADGPDAVLGTLRDLRRAARARR